MKPSATTLHAVRTALTEVHRLLLLVLKKEREGVLGRAVPAAEWFQTLLTAPEYQWVKALNSLLSDLDALSESNKISGQDLSVVRHELEYLFFKENGDVVSFNYHYRQIFAHHHDVIYAHGQLRQGFALLPSTVAPQNRDEIRLSWHKIGASKRKLLN